MRPERDDQSDKVYITLKFHSFFYSIKSLKSCIPPTNRRRGNKE